MYHAPVRWELLPEENAADGLAGDLGCHPLVAGILYRRGVRSAEEAERFLRPRLADLPDPSLLAGIEPAVARIVRAIDAGERITAYGDYDVDGVTSTTLLVSFLRACGADVDFYVPHRLEEGYGLNLEAVAHLAERGTRLLVTLDCGVTAVAEVDEAIRLGLEVVVVDHHTTPAELPRAAAILNPWQPGCTYPTRHLCAVGVTFLLCAALRRSLRARGRFAQRPEPNLKSYLDLVALGTIADVVPLTEANRLLVREGLEVLARTKRPGLQALKRVAGVEPDGAVTAGQVGFRLGPRINAAGRLDDAGKAVELLLCDDPARAERLARELDAANAERQAIERGLVDEALVLAESQPGACGLVLAGDGWHPGVVGIVASRVVSKLHRPAVVIGIDPETGVGKGSGRSISAFDLYGALSRCSEHLERYGGHKHAAGVTVARESLEDFRRAFEREAEAQLAGHDLTPVCRVDGTLRPSDVNETLCEALEALAPFGAGNPEPVLALMGVRARGRIVGGTDRGPGHLKLTLDAAPTADAIGFGMGDRLGELSGPVDLAFTLGFNEFRGERRVQLGLRDLRPTRS
ncbi:single-stranded-DNA-specific exonuclease RecJ [Vulgatibacter incomptus]|uniref:single-stranded-DNA-specific exonuclease RecJ n=1 Tax=Vulgatibacter incomptus TaxID=1391653 RepID=UPI001F0B0D2B|nr:single-stranded-DNA-specific exonuclease RecJ [Vulgatibacter incomptus]